MNDKEKKLGVNSSKQLTTYPLSEIGITKSNENMDNFHMFNELKYFKNEILEEMKNLKQELSKKFMQNYLELNEKIRQVNESNLQLEEKMENISTDIDKKLEGFSNEIKKFNLDMTINSLNNSMRVNDFKIESIKLDLKNHMEKTEDIVKENLLYPGMIGLGCKYKNLKQFFDFVIVSISNLGSENNKRTNEIKNFKLKTESGLINVHGKINEIIADYKSFAKDNLKELEIKFNEKLKYYEDKCAELKVQNINNNLNIEQKLDAFDEKYENMKNAEKNIDELNQKTMKEIDENTSSKINQFNSEFQSECKNINNKIKNLQNFNREIKQKLLVLNTILKKNIFFFKDEKDLSNPEIKNNNNNINNNLSSKLTSKIESDNTSNKKYKEKASEALMVNENDLTNGKENISLNKGNPNLAYYVSNIFLEINKEKTGKNLDIKKLLNKRLEKYQYLYQSKINDYDDKYYNKSVEEEDNKLSLEKKLKRTDKRLNLSLPRLSARKNINNKNEKNKIENFNSRKLYQTGLLVIFNSKDEEKKYISKLKSNALCLKLLEKGVKFDVNDFLNRSTMSKFTKDYYPEFKKEKEEKEEKEKIKEKKYISLGKKKKEKEKLFENAKISEKDSSFFLNEQKLFNDNSKNKIKVKNLSAII